MISIFFLSQVLVDLEFYYYLPDYFPEHSTANTSLRKNLSDYFITVENGQCCDDVCIPHFLATAANILSFALLLFLND